MIFLLSRIQTWIGMGLLGLCFVSRALASEEVTEPELIFSDSICTFSKIPILSLFVPCRASTETREAALKSYWQSEDDAELCHYFYFPLADPSASEALLMTNYRIMEAEIKARDVDCIEEHRNIFWYRGKQTKSMLTKLLDNKAAQTHSDVSAQVQLKVRHTFTRPRA